MAKKEDPNDPFHKVRQWARVSLSKKFFPYREKFHENECDETYRDPDYDQVPQWDNLNYGLNNMCNFQFYCLHSNKKEFYVFRIINFRLIIDRSKIIHDF